MSTREPSSAIIRNWLDYDEVSGVFIWIRNPKTVGSLLGRQAGGREQKYRLISVPKFGQIGAHRLAWIYMRGPIPIGMEVDHADGNPSNNAFYNLRLATSSQQKRNKRVQSNNRSGLKGAYFHAIHKGKKWRSQIKVDGLLIFLGYFHTAIEAHESYTRAELRYFGEFASSRRAA